MGTERSYELGYQRLRHTPRHVLKHLLSRKQVKVAKDLHGPRGQEIFQP